MVKIERVLAPFMAVLLLTVMLSGCVTEVAGDLPYDRLPTLETGAPVRLAASPTHAGSEFQDRPQIPAGAALAILGQDESGANLLVFDGKTIGWLPSVFSASAIAAEDPILIIDPLPASCGSYLGTIHDFSKNWTADRKGPVVAYGAIFRPAAAPSFGKATLNLQVSGAGRVVASDYMHVRLTRAEALVVFAFAVDGVEKGTRLALQLNTTGGEPLISQAAFFSNLCRNTLNPGAAAFTQMLPVGKARATAQRWNFTGDEATTVELEPTPRIINRQVGPQATCRPPYASRLKPGGRAWSISNGLVNVRSGPGKQYATVGKIGPGQALRVVAGPTCADDMYWWHVQVDGGADGWASEGAGNEYLLGPQQPAQQLTCSAPAGPSFARLWSAARQGCAKGAETGVTTAYESFERGWMLWRQDNLVHYAFFADGAYVSFWYPSAEPPNFACEAARAAGSPRRGFSKVWCENPSVRERIGAAVMNEVGDWRPVQEFDQGFMIYVKERGTVVTIFKNGSWMEQR